jgi:aminoglycoside 2'-N-acetyltransferase I
MNVHSFHSAVLPTNRLTAEQRNAILSVCDAAYGEPMTQYLADIGPGTHLLGYEHDHLVAHAMIVERVLYPEGASPLQTAYVELVATHLAAQRRGHATELLRLVPLLADQFDIAALSPSDAAFYARLGWQLWRGPLAMRHAECIEATPDEEIMILRLPKTPPALDLDVQLAVDWRPGEVW